MGKVMMALAAALAISGCLARHAAKEIPPPGGCDVCHRYKISSDWELGIATVPLGREGGVLEDSDIVLRELRQLPYHAAVTSKRLSVFAVSATPEVLGDEERGVQCFVCHRSPDPPHQQVRGKFPHPWGETVEIRESAGP
jgi:hypothetical protein